MEFLKQQGFIRVEKSGMKAFGYVLLVNPFLVIARKIKRDELKDKAWINAFISRCSEIGAELPDELQKALETRQAAKPH